MSDILSPENNLSIATKLAGEPPTHEEDPILTQSEVARRVGKSPTTIARWIHDGLLKAIRHPNGLPGIRQSEVNKFLGGTALPVREV